jgi:hypothetical protein
MIPLWLKISYFIFLCILIPVYYRKWGPANFLWFSDIALLGTGFGLWFESSLLVSMMTVGVFLSELLWNVDYFVRLLTGKKIIGISDYMFDSSKPLFLRALSLFHVFLPIVMLYLLYNLKYDEYALLLQIPFSWLIFLITYFFTDPKANINWVFGLGDKPQKKIPKHIYLVLIIIFFPLVFYVPTHFLLKWLF